MKKSAVDFLEEIKTKSFINRQNFKEAKEIEKKQLRECYNFAQMEQQKEFSSIYVGMNFEKWYKEIYDNE